MAAVKLVSLTKEYQNGENYIRAVDDVSFSIKEGEFIAVIGASGSGKSTLINLISGLEKPTHGCVYVHDVNLTQLSLEEQISFRRWHIGVVFIVIGKPLISSRAFPPLHTVHATFTAHGVPSVSIFHCLNNQPLNRIKTVVVEIRLNRLHGSQLTKVVNLYKLFAI